MRTDLNEMIAELSPTRRKQVEARAAELIAEELKARELPEVRKVMQSNDRTRRDRKRV